MYTRFLTAALALAVLLPGWCAAQGNGFSQARPVTHALIVGISDYAHLDDLRFADRDARIFRQYLAETMAGKADTARITLLLNQQATSPAVYKALEDLVAMAGEGDRVYIYFSGHGDSENTTIFRSGFLLTHDTPAKSYYTNSVNIDLLNQFMHTLSAGNKAEVIFIADACRSGQGNAGGSLSTAKALTGNVADEVRILSCQPEEISLEGEQWGGGRGLFSYHLVNALYGMADPPDFRDGKVTLNELNLYLSTRVPRDASPVSQFPGIFGPMQKTVGLVHEPALARIREEGAGPTAMAPVAHKGYEDRFLAALSDGQRELYGQFRTALDRRGLGTGSNDAPALFERLVATGLPPVLEGLLRRNLAAMLQEDPQLFIHQLADVNIRWDQKDIQYGKWAQQMLMAADLLGGSHALHNTLMGKHYFFAGAEKYFAAKKAKDAASRKKLASEAVKLVNRALEADSLVAFYHNLKGIAVNGLDYPETAIRALDEAIRINPAYPYPYANKGNALIKLGRYEEALAELDTCIALDPAYTNAYEAKIQALKKLGRDQEAIGVYRELMKVSGNRL